MSATGEDLRVVLFATTEGEEKPAKYPTICHTADLAIWTKADLAEAAEFDRARARATLAEVRPDLPFLELSAKTGTGMDDWLVRLEAGRAAKRG